MAPGTAAEGATKTLPGMASEMPPSMTDKPRFLLLYGSQTGQAQAIADEIADKASDHSLHADIHCLSTTDKAFHLEKESCVVIVVSTTGDGDPPDTAIKFWRKIKKKTLPDDYLSKVSYALLGLGDTNYSNFCNNPKIFHKRLSELGASTFHDPAWADDAVGLEQTVQPWMDGLWPALKRHLSEVKSNLPADGASTETSSTSQKPTDAVDLDCQSIPASEQTSDGETIRQNETSTPFSEQSICNSEVGNSSNSVCDTTKDIPRTSQQNPKDQTSQGQMKEVTVQEESLTCSLPPLCESAVNVPALSPPFLEISFHRGEELDVSTLPIQNGCPLPSSSSDVHMAAVTKATMMTRHDAVKKALKLELDISDCGWSYEPGDAFGIVCPNSDEEVSKLLERLDLTVMADVPYTLSIVDGTKKRNAAIPPHIPAHGTLNYVLTTCCDIRSSPKKALLRAMVEVTKDADEKRRLQELCSRQGASHYTKYIREPSLSILDVLLAFPSCRLSVKSLLEHLPRLAPRPYSAASCVSVHPERLHFVFNIIEIPPGSGRHGSRRGVCTSWLDDVTKSIQGQGHDKQEESELNLHSLSLDTMKIPIYLRSNQHFRPPSDLSVPLIMVGPGTGVAPFIGFLQYRKQQLKDCDGSTEVAPSWLYYGCRHQDRDYLFREELESFASSGTLTNLRVSFSRDAASPDDVKYVQHNILHDGAELVDVMTTRDAVIYVCGDAKNMARDVTQAFVDILVQHKGMTTKDAMGYIMEMRLARRYKEDVWT